MKLRLRSFETKETLKLEIPNPCTLQELRELVFRNLPSSSHSSPIYFSLNRKDELTTNSPQESIQSIGITSGDLIHFTTNPNGFSTSSPPKSQNSQTLIPNSDNQNETLNPEKGKTVLDSEEVPESTETDDGVDSVSEVGKSFSVPSFLRKVFTDELGNDGGLNHKLLGIAVRAVLLESGFIEIDVKIKFQNLGKYCKVYGSLVNGTAVHSVLLDEDKLVPFLNVVWANCGQVVETMAENNRVSSIEPEKEVFDFWRKVKDGLALPLLIDLCEKSDLELPPCFTRLPTELKLKILESVSGVDVANVSCVCSEMRYLASSDDLWKQKYIQQFGNVGGSENGRSFKERFAKSWEGRNKRKIVGWSAMSVIRRLNPYRPFGIGNFPRMIGGDYDLLPNVGSPRGLDA